MNERLDQFLASEAAQGLFLEEGQFRLDPEKALEKLSRFALPEPGLWVVKLLQAAVASGATQIKFTFERRLVSVDFIPPETWDAEDLMHELLSANTPSDSARRHLFAGILGAALGFSQEIAWACGDKVVIVDKNGPRAEDRGGATHGFRLQAKRPHRSALKSGFFSSPINYLFKQTAQEFKALVDRSRVCPIEILIDNRPLPSTYQVAVTDLSTVSGYDSEKSSGRQALFAQIPLTNLGRSPLPYPIDDTPLESVVIDSDKFVSWRMPVPPTDPVEGVACLYGCLQRRSRINYVMDGVLLQDENLFEDNEPSTLKHILIDDKENFVIDLYLAVDWQDLDLTQMAVRDQSRDEIHKALISQLIPVFRGLQARCHNPWELCTRPTVDRSSGQGISVGGVLGIGFASMFIPHAIVLGGMFGGAFLAYKAATSVGIGKTWVENLQERAHNSKVEAFQTRLTEVVNRLTRLHNEFQDQAAAPGPNSAL